jgi:hypothetical protein
VMCIIDRIYIYILIYIILYIYICGCNFAVSVLHIFKQEEEPPMPTMGQEAWLYPRPGASQNLNLRYIF